MRFFISLAALLVLGISASAQITTAENGLNSPSATNVRLGGTLLQNTYIDLGNSNNLHFKKDGSYYLSILNNGNVGLGTDNPTARLSFQSAGIGEDPIGITWSGTTDPTQYGIHRTAGTWSNPNYQQLRLGWLTGIILDPGTELWQKLCGYSRQWVARYIR